MGIPTYFKDIVKSYDNVIVGKCDVDIDHLLIDFNAMIYQDLRIISLESDKNLFSESFDRKLFEEKLIASILKSINNIINIVRPQKSLFLALDGPPPLAKIYKQRSRRYKSVLETKFKKELEKKYETLFPEKIKNFSGNKWSTASISPGTLFMKKLSKAIRTTIMGTKFGLIAPGFKIIFSDDQVSGEGEHKLLKVITDNTVIYSPDADLIVLLMRYNYKNLFILRSIEDLGSNIPNIPDIINCTHVYLNINKYKEQLILFNRTSFQDRSSNKFLIDYSFLTYICGNDFVTSSQILKIKEGGLDVVIDSYRSLTSEEQSSRSLTSEEQSPGSSSSNSISSENLITDNNLISFDMFKNLIKVLKSKEQSLYQDLQKKRDRMRKYDKCEVSEKKYEGMEPWSIEFLKFQHYEYVKQDHPLHKKYDYLFNKINYYNDNWINEYNNYFFKSILIKDVCRDYIKSLYFCLGYYCPENRTLFQENKFSKILRWSWNWAYTYRNAPTFHDLSNYLDSITQQEFENLSIFEPSVPYKPLEQLVMILPEQMLYLIPKNIANIVKKSDIIVKKYDVDVVQGLKFIYCEPILPDIPCEKIVSLISEFKNSEKEKERTDFVFNV